MCGIVLMQPHLSLSIYVRTYNNTYVAMVTISSITCQRILLYNNFVSTYIAIIIHSCIHVLTAIIVITLLAYIQYAGESEAI